MAEVLACIESSIPNWSVKHLSLWTELVVPEVEEDAINEIDMESVEEATAVALYHEVCSKISSLGRIDCRSDDALRVDETTWSRYRHQLTKQKARQHVVSVTHAKSQNIIGTGRLSKRSDSHWSLGSWKHSCRSFAV